ncbi:MAG: CHRD domain-containing protein [Pseudonocardiaceae bacterium]
MRYSKRARATGRAGVCLASVSSIVLLVGPTSAAAHAASPVDQPGNGHFLIQLTGSEVPEGGDPDGRGSATLDLDRTKQQVCFSIAWTRLRGSVTALHLNAAARGAEGPPWIAFFDKQSFPGARSIASGCIASSQDKIDAVISNPAGYYLAADSTTFGKSAIRGQLA